MIYTVTFNPSLDYTVHMPVFRAGTINRVVQEAVIPEERGLMWALFSGVWGFQ